MRKYKKSSVLLAAVIVLLVLPLASIKGDTGVTTDARIAVDDHQLIVETQAPSGEVEALQVVDWLALDGKGTISIERPTGLEDPPKVQPLNGFSTPEVKDNNMIWKDVSVDGPRNLITQNTVSENSRGAALEKLPIELKYSYWLDGEKVEDLNDIAGKSGHFRLECDMKNTSKEKSLVTYTDSVTGKKVTERVETYLPLVISPTNWFFDNNVFSNLKADPTCLIVYLPTYYQTGWSIPLFPPATEESFNIWVEADVKNFAMDPLTMAVAFVFPHTNQNDPIPQFQAGLTQLYGGVTQLGTGLAEAVAGLGSTGAADTLIFGANAIAGGMAELVGPEGLPAAGAALSDQLIPGVETLYGGIGSTTTPDTLLYGASAISDGLAQAQAGIGSATTPDTLLYGASAITGGLGTIAAGIGSATTPDTLLYGASAITGGLGTIKDNIGNTGNPATLQGGLQYMKTSIGTTSDAPTASLEGALQYISTKIGSTTVPAQTLLYGAASVQQGLTNPGDPLNPGILQGLQLIKDGIGDKVAPAAGTLLWYLHDMLAQTAGTGGLIDYINPVIVGMSPPGGELYTMIDNAAVVPLLANRNTMKDYMSDYVTKLGTVKAGIQSMHLILSGTILKVEESVDGLDTMIAGLGDAGTYPSILYGVNAIINGLGEIKAGIGVPNPYESSLLGGLEKMKYGIGTANPAEKSLLGGLEAIKAGIGSATTPDTLLYGTHALTGGLAQTLMGIGSATTPDTLLYGANAVTGGLTDLSAGIGSVTTPDSLLYGANAVFGGLDTMKAGISTGDPGNPGLLEGLGQLEEGTAKAVAGIGSPGTPDTLLYGATQIEGGLGELQAGLTKAVNEGTNVMAAGLTESINELDLTMGELKAIEKAGKNFDTFLGRVDKPKSANSDVRVLMQTKPVQNSRNQSVWIWMLIISVVAALAVVLLGSFAFRKLSA